MTHNDKITALEDLTKIVERLTENDRNTPYNTEWGDPKEVNEVLEHHYLIGLLSFTMRTLTEDLAKDVLSTQAPEVTENITHAN